MTGYLADRALVRVSGEDAEHFLENLVTCSVAGIQPGAARFGALLTPQGKILFDFFIVKTGDGYLLDTPSNLRDEFLKRLLFYRLRANVQLVAEDGLSVCTSGSKIDDGVLVSFADPRNATLGYRAIDEKRTEGPDEAYHCRRVQLGMPEGGMDFEYGDAFPHEALMDQFGGVDFKKGCYVGQEVVSRMQHRGTARKRIVKVSAQNPLPPAGTDIIADDKPAGTLGTVLGTDGLALVRLDRVHGATLVLAGDTPITVALPEWVSFTWPEAG